MCELGLVFALRVVSASCIHVCAHVEGVNIITVRNHLREEDASTAVPSGHLDSIDHATVLASASVFPLIKRILCLDGVDISECSNLVPRVPAGVNQVDLDSSLGLYLKQIMGAL